MSNWRRWVWPGLASTIVLSALAVAFRSGGMERDLAARISAELSAAGQDWVVLDVSGRSVAIGGTAPSEEARRLAVEAAATVAGAGPVDDRTELLAVASPYGWSAERLGRKLAYVHFTGLPALLFDRARDPGWTRNLIGEQPRAALAEAQALLSFRMRVADRRLASCQLTSAGVLGRYDPLPPVFSG